MNSNSIVKSLILIISFIAITGMTLAGNGPGPSKPPANPVVCDNFVDVNGDGVCDNCRSLAYQHKGADHGNGPVCDRFIDLDGDGICDNCDQFDCLHDGICDGTGPKGPGPRR